MANKQEQKNADISLSQIEFYVPEELHSRYANLFTLQLTDHECILSFFEFIPPLIFGTAKEQKAQLESYGPQEAECVARVIISKPQLTELHKAIESAVNQLIPDKK